MQLPRTGPAHGRVVIRPATTADAAGILACLAAAFEPYRQQYTAAAFADTTLDERTIHERLRAMHVLVAVADGGVVGTVAGAVAGREGHLRGMAVLPSYSGSGVASSLLNAIEAELRLRRCTRVTLDTTEPLERAMRFYERDGYRRTGRVSDFFAMRLIQYAKKL